MMLGVVLGNGFFGYIILDVVYICLLVTSKNTKVEKEQNVQGTKTKIETRTQNVRQDMYSHNNIIIAQRSNRTQLSRIQRNKSKNVQI